MLKEYKKVKHVFKRPRLCVFFGFWSTPWFALKTGKWLLDNKDKEGTFKYKVISWISNLGNYTDPCLPVWRRGPMIRPFPKKRVYIKNPDTRAYEYQWEPEFKKKLDKWHLSWLKMEYELPRWMSFHVFNFDMCWKWKYDDVRYEFPPQFSIVLFNISLSLWWIRPKSNLDSFGDMLYWESILTYTYKYKETLKGKSVDMLSQLIGLNDYMGYWYQEGKDGKPGVYTWNVQPEYLRNEEYARVLKEHQEIKEKEIDEKRKKLTCPKCGGRLILDEDIVLMSNPPKYQYHCWDKKCGEIVYLDEKLDSWML